MLDNESARALEESLLDPSVRASAQRMDALIADDFIEFGSSGRVFSKRDVLDSASSLPDVVTPLVDLEATVLGRGIVLVTYRSATRNINGLTHRALRSAVWVYRNDRWQLRFHQGTPVSAQMPGASG